MDVTVTIPDRLAAAVQAAAAARGDKDAQTWVARAVREALDAQAYRRVEEAQQAAYQSALDAARRQAQADLGAISAK